MRVHVGNPALLPDLVEFLRARVDAVVTPVNGEEAEVSLLGSYAEVANRMEVYLRVRAWEAARRAADAEILD
jgi:hypothetical protein